MPSGSGSRSNENDMPKKIYTRIGERKQWQHQESDPWVQDMLKDAERRMPLRICCPEWHGEGQQHAGKRGVNP